LSSLSVHERVDAALGPVMAEVRVLVDAALDQPGHATRTSDAATVT